MRPFPSAPPTMHETESGITRDIRRFQGIAGYPLYCPQRGVAFVSVIDNTLKRKTKSNDQLQIWSGLPMRGARGVHILI